MDVIGANHTHFANVCTIGDLLIEARDIASESLNLQTCDSYLFFLPLKFDRNNFSVFPTHFIQLNNK